MSTLHSSFLNILLNASSTDGNKAAKDITSVCRSFFNQEKAGLADQKLSVLFRELGFQDVGFAHGFVQVFVSGHFLYHEPGCTNNFSIFCFYEKLRDALDNKRRLLMHLSLRKAFHAKMKVLKRQISWQGNNLTERKKRMTRRKI